MAKRGRRRRTRDELDMIAERPGAEARGRRAEGSMSRTRSHSPGHDPFSKDFPNILVFQGLGLGADPESLGSECLEI